MTNSKFNIVVLGELEIVGPLPENGLFNINATYFKLEDKDKNAIEFAGQPWQEGLTQEQLDSLDIGGYSIHELQSFAA